jgi:hypothetical protein
VLTIRSPIAPTIQHPENTWVTGGLVTNVTRTVVVGTRIGILTVTATPAVTIGIGTGTHTAATAATGVTDAAQHLVGAADDIRLTIGVAGVTPGARPAEAAPPEPGITIHQPVLLQPMRPGGERNWYHVWVKNAIRSGVAECRSGLRSARFQFKFFKSLRYSILEESVQSGLPSFNSTKFKSSWLTLSVSTSKFLFLLVIALL